MDESYRPRALRVMAEYGEQDPAWDSDIEHMGPVTLAELGVSEDLVRRLRGWNERFNAIALTDFRFGSAAVEDAWADEGLRLAYELQNELPHIVISYVHDDDPRPLRDRRGPG